ncbi:MAG: polysaccharide deacetylase family protein [Dermatophilaceae bacterium]
MSDEALPVLMYHSVPAQGPGGVLAVPVGRVREQWQALADGGWELMGLTAGFVAKAADPDRKIVCLTFDDALQDFEAVPELLAERGAGATLYVPTAHVGCDAEQLGYDPGTRLLDWDALAALPDSVEIGSHGHRHLPQDLLTSEALADELARSRHLLAERTGRQAMSFCYPHGYASARTATTVRGAGFANACVIGHRLGRSVSDDRWRFPRMHVLAQHRGADVVRMAHHGVDGLRPRLVAAAQPPWRVVRRAAHRTTGVVWT